MTAAFTSAADVDLSDIELWRSPMAVRAEAFRLLRTQRPVSFHREADVEGFPAGPGYWALTTFDDVWQASRNPKVFSSGQGTVIPDFPVEIAEFMGSIINMDDPRHARLRSIVQKGFTPKQITQIDDHVRSVAASVIDRVLERFPNGECDFVSDIAAPLPLEIICEMMGIPPEDQAQIFGWTNIILAGGDPEYLTSFDELVAAALGMFSYAQAMGEARLAHPTDDLTSAIMQAEVDGERLTASEFGSFFILLVVAGNETTRTAVSHGMHLLTEHPDQRAVWWNNFEEVLPTAVEEIVRFASPVNHMRRTALEATDIGGQRIAAGDKVVLWYGSANFDERHWNHPFAFDVTRTPNDHVGFGAGGPHFCLGANLARREIGVMFREIHNRLPDLQITGEPALLQSSFVNGIKRMPCAFTPRG
jgi:cytochrome P450